MALRDKRNEFARAHHLSGIDDYFDFAMNKQGLLSVWDDFSTRSQEKLDEVYGAFERNALTNERRNLAMDRTFSKLNVEPLEILRRTAGLIGQSRQLENILRSSDLFEDPSRPGKTGNVAGLLSAIDAPHDLRALANSPQKAYIRHMKILIHEILGHGLSYAALDPTLPGQLRDENPFSHLVDEAFGLLLEKQIFTEVFWTQVLKAPEQAKALEKQLAYKRLIFLAGHLRNGTITAMSEKKVYGEMKQEPWDLVNGPFFSTHPVYIISYSFGIAWGSQLEAAMIKKHGGLLTEDAWNDIQKVLSHGKLLNWQEQIKLLTSSSKEIENIDRLLRGNPADFQKAKARIPDLSGAYFTIDALFKEMNDLMDILGFNE